MDKRKQILPVILCGGTGSRLWPLSRETFPKQFCKLLKNSKLSLIQETYERISDIPNLIKPLVVANEKYRFLVSEHLKAIGCKFFDVILEQEGRNTCPAIALAALKAIENGEDPFLLVLSSDHFIKDKFAFQKIINNALENINEEFIYTFGVKPTNPETGYGYIEIGEKEKNLNTYYRKVSKFVEKPNLEKAQKFIQSEKYLWNSGIFLFKASCILKEIKKYESETFGFCEKSFSKRTIDNDFIRPETTSFLKCESKPIDIAVLEKSSKVHVISLDLDWSDIGDWNKLWEKSPKDKNSNVFKGNGKVILKDTKNSYIYSQESLFVGIGLEDITVVNTKDALLVISKKFNHLLKNVVQEIKDIGLKESFSFQKEYRPWGSYSTLNKGDRWHVKEIIVKPQEKLSLQSHFHRSEHWIVVKGTALVEIDGIEKLVRENESVYVPLGSKHRLSNPGKIDVNLIEVQTGSFLEEEDIVRYDDIYGRPS